jgi:transposase
MARGLGRQRERQADILVASGFDRFVETQCAKEYAPCRGRPSLPPGRYFRMLLTGYFEGIDSERGLEWRCADSLSLRVSCCRLVESTTGAVAFSLPVGC